MGYGFLFSYSSPSEKTSAPGHVPTDLLSQFIHRFELALPARPPEDSQLLQATRCRIW